MPKFNKRKRAIAAEDNNSQHSSGSENDEEDIEEMIAAGIFPSDQHTTTLSSTTTSNNSKHNRSNVQINDIPALQRALESVQKELPWLERLEVVSAEPILIDNVQDDLKVELAL